MLLLNANLNEQVKLYAIVSMNTYEKQTHGNHFSTWRLRSKNKVNPIGAHTKKHKLSVFFWTLLNIPPKHRSKLSCIQLIAVAKARDCKEFGFLAIPWDFAQGLKVLYREGICVRDCCGADCAVQCLKGGLVAFCGDTIASNRWFQRRCRLCPLIV